MDVSLILTHRCNLACDYCYAGEHHKTDMEPAVRTRSVSLLFADGATQPQLSFFGGEPFLAFDAMKLAVEQAEARARESEGQVRFQCTTNGSALDDERIAFIRDHDVHITVSIDGIREAHDRHRSRAGGKPSFDQVITGLRRLVASGAKVDAMMVITPETACHAYLSCNFLWAEGVKTIRANVALGGVAWSDEARAELREQLVSIGYELLARRLRGEDVSFRPFESGMSSSARASVSSTPAAPPARVVVGTSGHLYPCAPMVGTDRDGEPGAALRIGHVDDDTSLILAAVRRDGVSCSKGGRCECAAYLETGDRRRPGRMSRWYGLVCHEIGATLAEALARHERQPQPTASKRRAFLFGLAAVVGGAAVALPFWPEPRTFEQPPSSRRPCRIKPPRVEPPFVEGEMIDPAPEPVMEPPPPAVLGEMPARLIEPDVDGELEMILSPPPSER